MWGRKVAVIYNNKFIRFFLLIITCALGVTLIVEAIAFGVPIFLPVLFALFFALLFIVFLAGGGSQKTGGLTNAVKDISVLGVLHNIYLVVDEWGNFRYMEPSFEKHTGFSTDDLTGSTIFDYLNPSDVKIIKEFLKKSKAINSSPFYIDIRLKCKDGSYTIFESEWHNYLSKPSINGFAVYLRNTSRYNSVIGTIGSTKIDPCDRLKNVPVMIFITDNSGVLINVSNYLLETFGYSRDEVLGLNVLDFITDEFRAYVEQVTEEELKVFGFYKDVPCKCLKHNGDVLDVLLSSVSIKDDDNQIVGYQGVISNVTDLRQIENLLRTNKELYKKILYTIPDVFIQCDIAGTVTYINEKGLQILQAHSVENVLGTNLFSLVAPEDRSLAEHNFRLMQDKHIGNVEYKLNLGTNYDVFCEVNGDVLRDSSNVPYGLIFIIRDITQRKNYEKQLLASEEKYRSLVETSPNMTLELRPDGSIMYVSPQSYNILGLSPDDMCKRLIYDIIEPKEIDRTVKKLFDSITNHDRVIGFEVEARHALTSKRIFLDIYASLFYDEKGVVIGLRGIARDITIRKVAEIEAKKNRDYLSLVLKESGIGLWFTNWKENKTSIDEVWANSLGYSLNELGTIPSDSIPYVFIHPDDVDEVQRYIDSSISQKSTANFIEHRMFTKGGDIKWVQSTIKVLSVDQSGLPIEMIGLMKDVTERKLAELKVFDANAAKDKIFSIIAHDLRNPLNAIIGFSELMTNSTDLHKVTKLDEYSYHIHSAALSLTALLENLLEWANTQRGMVTYNPKPINLDDVIGEEIESAMYVAKRKDITINSFNNKLRVYADIHLLRIIIRNLLTNAIKYSNTNSKIDIYSIDFNDRVEVNIHDRGVGMSDEIMNNLFKLTKTSQRGTSNEKGTGLGLMICKEFVEKQGGKIWVDSKLGEGSTFTFSIPVQSLD